MLTCKTGGERAVFIFVLGGVLIFVQGKGGKGSPPSLQDKFSPFQDKNPMEEASLVLLLNS